MTIGSAKHTLRILTYHRITDDLRLRGHQSLTSASPFQFEKQLKFLQKKFYITSFAEIKSLISKKLKLPKNCLIITFDDGYKDNYTNAYSILQKHNIPATFFITTGFINKRYAPWWDEISEIISKTKIPVIKTTAGKNISLMTKEDKDNAIQQIIKDIKTTSQEEIFDKIAYYTKVLRGGPLEVSEFMSWGELREMSNRGMEICPHTVSHCNLNKVPLLTARREIHNSKIAIEKETGREIVAFSYPFGSSDSYNENIKGILERENFFCAVSTNTGINLITRDTEWYSLKRIDIQRKDNLMRFRAKLNKLALLVYERIHGAL
jgi:peptidoglycan/xylan/chitin deacetylase (PgdA/CDA1 family)